MKKIIVTTIVSITVFCVCSFLQGQDDKTNLPRFAVISDLHFGNNRGMGPMVKVPNALRNILGKERIDALFVVGDLTDSSKEYEYNLLLKVFSDKQNVPAGLAVYFMMGNHDHINKSVDTEKFYTDKLRQPLHQFVEIKGYPFITISPSRNGYSNDAKKFLSEKLAISVQKYPSKPIFVFTHYPPLNTCYGSATGNWGSDILSSILASYPQAIVFCGHSHFPIGDPRSIHQDKFTTVNDGSTTYTGVEKGEISTTSILPENFDNITEGLIVNVLQNGNVEIERWDTFRNEEILPKWTVNSPHDGNNFHYKNRNENQPPFFAEGSKPVVSDFTADSCVITFPQAKDNEIVHHYLIEILEGDQVITSIKKCSQFYLNSWMPIELSVRFSKLPANKTFTAKITAIDSYKNNSITIQSEPFSLPK
ncbi:MAG: metallophosphoesterase [Planctomycetaceae bacterium]|nr:metallophosphoesterase [Planctomycetaceae bacterium]